MTHWYAVVAEEDDYYPDIQTIGIFETEEAANAFASAQPLYVYPWRDIEYGNEEYRAQMAKQKRAYHYQVIAVPVSPSGDWKPRAE